MPNPTSWGSRDELRALTPTADTNNVGCHDLYQTYIGMRSSWLSYTMAVAETTVVETVNEG